MKTAAMNRPTTPNFNFGRQAGPSSPPDTPTANSFAFQNRRHGMHFTQSIPLPNDNIKPTGRGTAFTYHPSIRPADLSPRSSSPDSTHHSSSDSSSGTDSPPRSRSPSSEPGEPVSVSPPRSVPTRVISPAQANFILEELTPSDLSDLDSDDEDNIIRPTHYEDAESDCGSQMHSTRAAALASDLDNLQLRREVETEEVSREAWLETLRQERRRKRRSSGSVQKRTISQSIGSDTDDEDLQPMQLDAHENGAGSDRRLRRKVGDRSSLIFDDPPPRIEELEEPESCEEVVAFDEESDGEKERRAVDRELPYYMQMDIDEEEEEDEEDEEDEGENDDEDDDDEESSGEDEWNSLRAVHMMRSAR